MEQLGPSPHLDALGSDANGEIALEGHTSAAGVFGGRGQLAFQLVLHEPVEPQISVLAAGSISGSA